MHAFIKLPRIAAWFLLASSAIGLPISLYAYFHAQSFVRSATQGRGTIVKLAEHSFGLGKAYFPVYTFRDEQGRDHEITSSLGRYPPSHQVGDTVQVLYQASQPERARLDEFSDIWGWVLIAGSLDAMTLIVGLAMLVISLLVTTPK